MKNEVPAAEEKKETAGELSAETVEWPPEREILTIAQNRDNHGLLPSGIEYGMCPLGYVDEVNGGAAQETPGFIPTRHELIQLMKYWYRRSLEIEWFYFLTSRGGSAAIPLRTYAKRRIARIAKLVGKKEVDDAIEEVRNKRKATVDARLWDIFEHGDRKQWNAVRKERDRQMAKEKRSTSVQPRLWQDSEV
jgi:hypothetical protein